MLSSLKKIFLLLLLISIAAVAYWFFFASHWGISIPKEQPWKHSFQAENISTLKNLKWSNGNVNQVIEKTSENKTLVFQSDFEINNPESILEASLECNNKYSFKIYINNIECADINHNLISGGTDSNSLTIEEHWRPRKATLTQQALRNSLKKGNNTISIVVYNVQNLKALEAINKQLSFLCKGHQNNFESSLKLKKPTPSFTESSLPILRINTKNKTIPDDPKITASLKIIEGNNINTLKDSSTNYPIKIEVRGNTSQDFAKQSYSFNIYDAHAAKKSTPLLDMPASKKWILQGPYADKSLIRNPLTYTLYRQMGNYAPKTEFVELIINNNYRGIYLLTEKIQIGKNHLNIQKLKQDSLDKSKLVGGYLLEIDRNEWLSNYPPKSANSTFPIAYNIFSPKKNKIKPEFVQKIKSQFNLFEQHLYSDDDIFSYIDLNSFIDYLIITELTKNTDGYCLSTFLYNKNINDSIPKFYIGPIWDYNLSFGLADYRDSFNPEGFVYNSTKYIPFWWENLLSNKFFKAALIARYSELRITALSNDNINITIDSLTLICAKPAELNFKKWVLLGGSPPWPNYYTGKTHKDEIDYIKNWTKDRLVFLDEQFQPNSKLD